MSSILSEVCSTNGSLEILPLDTKMSLIKDRIMNSILYSQKLWRSKKNYIHDNAIFIIVSFNYLYNETNQSGFDVCVKSEYNSENGSNLDVYSFWIRRKTDEVVEVLFPELERINVKLDFEDNKLEYFYFNYIKKYVNEIENVMAEFYTPKKQSYYDYFMQSSENYYNNLAIIPIDQVTVNINKPIIEKVKKTVTVKGNGSIIKNWK